jgi:hypothetical protein
VFPVSMFTVNIIVGFLANIGLYLAVMIPDSLRSMGLTPVVAIANVTVCTFTCFP